MLEGYSTSSRELPGMPRDTLAEAGPLCVFQRSLPGLIQICAWPDTVDDARSFIHAAAGVMPPADPGTSSRSDSAVVMNIAPGRFLIEPADATQETGLLQQDLGHIGTRTDLGHSRTCIRLSGAGVTRTLAKGACLDLHASAFPPARVVQTTMHHIPLILHRIDRDNFDIYVYRSFAAYACEWLESVRQ